MIFPATAEQVRPAAGFRQSRLNTRLVLLHRGQVRRQHFRPPGIVFPHAREIRRRDVEVAERLEKEDAGDNDQKSAEVADDVLGGKAAPLAEQHGGREDDTPGEDHVQERSHNRSVEHVQRSVQIYHLHTQAYSLIFIIIIMVAQWRNGESV